MVGDVCFVKLDAILGGGGGLLHVKEVQSVANAILIAGNLQVVQSGVQREAPELYRVGHPGIQQPGLRRNPGVGHLSLPASVQPLTEQAIVVIEAHTVPVESQGGDGVQKAGGQAAQPAVTQGRLRFLILNLGQGAAVSGQ